MNKWRTILRRIANETDCRTAEAQRRRDIRAIPRLYEISGQIVNAAFAVHSTLGPGLLESVYERCLAYELGKRGLSVAQQVLLPIRYDELFIEAGFRLDMVVNGCVIIEIKSVERLQAVHDAQLLTYLKMANKKLGLLINFNVPCIKDGVRRLVRSQ